MLAWLLTNAAKRKKSLVRVGDPGIRVRKDYTLYIYRYMSGDITFCRAAKRLGRRL